MFKRKDAQAEATYVYDELPKTLRVQIVHVCEGLVDRLCPGWMRGKNLIGAVRQELCREFGVFELTKGAQSEEEDVYNFFLQQDDVERCLRGIELLLDTARRFVRSDTYVHFNGMDRIQQAVDELNQRFRQSSVGYEYTGNAFVRIDSGFLHGEVIAPALALLREPYLSGANEEFLKAHGHFRARRFGECINECLKAFESTMKAICHKKGWQHAQNATAKPLLDICEQNGLFPTYMQSSLGGLRSVLETVATFRNRLSGHGQGVQPVQLTEEVAAYVLHVTGANILFLASLAKK